MGIWSNEVRTHRTDDNGTAWRLLEMQHHQIASYDDIVQNPGLLSSSCSSDRRRHRSSGGPGFAGFVGGEYGDYPGGEGVGPPPSEDGGEREGDEDPASETAVDECH